MGELVAVMRRLAWVVDVLPAAVLFAVLASGPARLVVEVAGGWA